MESCVLLYTHTGMLTSTNFNKNVCLFHYHLQTTSYFLDVILASSIAFIQMFETFIADTLLLSYFFMFYKNVSILIFTTYFYSFNTLLRSYERKLTL
jgi:hypothetical protein